MIIENLEKGLLVWLLCVVKNVRERGVEYCEKVFLFLCILFFDNYYMVKSFMGVFNLKWEFCGNYILVLLNNMFWFGIF